MQHKGINHLSYFQGKDQGINIRHKVTEMIDFVQDDEKLRDERKKAKKNKDKYVGMSSSSNSGFSSKGFGGFDSGNSGGGGGGGGWKDDWNSHRSNTNPSGFRDHSDEEGGSRGPSPDADVAEFRDEDNDYSPVSPPSNTGSKKPGFVGFDTNAAPKSLSLSSRPSTAPTLTGSSTSKPRTSKPIKKAIDLGAAASLAASASSKPVQKPTSQMDLFGVSDEPVQEQPKTSQSAVNLFGGNDLDEDDFNPRSGSDSANANGDFGNFESAFGDQAKPAGLNSSASSANTDSFADFSSAFGGQSSSGVPSGSLPAPPTPPPGGSNFDLMAPAPVAATSAAASSNFDLLGGLVMSSSQPPPLVGLTSNFPPSTMDQAPQSMPSDLFQNPMGNMMQGGGPAQPISLMTMNNKSNNNHNVTSMASASMTSAANKKATLWDNVGNVNIDLDNLSLGGGNNKGKGLPMNALITPTASPQRTQHGSGLGMAPPPLKPAGGSLDLGDLLN